MLETQIRTSPVTCGGAGRRAKGPDELIHASLSVDGEPDDSDDCHITHMHTLHIICHVDHANITIIKNLQIFTNIKSSADEL